MKVSLKPPSKYRHRNSSMLQLGKSCCPLGILYVKKDIHTEIKLNYKTKKVELRNDSLRAGRSGDRTPVEVDVPHPFGPALEPIQPPLQLLPGQSRKKSSRGVAFTTHPYLAARLKKE
jgi:hypothetical protein